jgi:hypothetical protein
MKRRGGAMKPRGAVTQHHEPVCNTCGAGERPRGGHVRRREAPLRRRRRPHRQPGSLVLDVGAPVRSHGRPHQGRGVPCRSADGLECVADGRSGRTAFSCKHLNPRSTPAIWRNAAAEESCRTTEQRSASWIERVGSADRRRITAGPPSGAAEQGSSAAEHQRVRLEHRGGAAMRVYRSLEPSSGPTNLASMSSELPSARSNGMSGRANYRSYARDHTSTPVI